jgi:hypothetical protein
MHSTRSLVLSLAVATVLAACGGGGGNPGTTVPASPAAGTSPTAPANPAPAPTTPTNPTTPAPTSPSTPVTQTPPPVTPGGNWLSLTPSSVALNVNKGESRTFQITARSNRIITQAFNVGVIDSTGLITTDVQLSAISDLEYVATLHTAPGLPAGTHTTYLEVRLCEDAPLTCRVPLAGSPWYVPLTVTVQ